MRKFFSIWALWVNAVVIVAILPIALFVHKGLAPLFVLAAVVATVDRPTNWLRRPQVTLAFSAIVVMIVFGALSALWAPDRQASLASLGVVALTMAGAWILMRFALSLSESERAFLTRAVIIGGVLGYGFALVELVSGGFITRSLAGAIKDGPISDGTVANLLKPGLTVAALYLWPWAFALRKTLPTYIALTALVVAGLVLFLHESHATALALVVGLAVGLVGLWPSTRKTALALGGIFAVVILVMPLLIRDLPDPSQPNSDLSALPNSAAHRVYIWHVAEKAIENAPILGYGFNTSRALYGPATVAHIILFPDIPSRRMDLISEPIPLHPHNLVLQIWIEMGLVGASFLSLFVCGILLRIAGAGSRSDRCLALAVLGSAAVIAAVSYGAWQAWWLAALILIAMVTAAMTSTIGVQAIRQARKAAE